MRLQKQAFLTILLLANFVVMYDSIGVGVLKKDAPHKCSTYKRLDLIYSIPVTHSNKFIFPESKFIPEEQRFKSAFGIAMGFGEIFAKYFRGDIVASYRGNYKSKKIGASYKMDNISLMFNGYITPELVKQGDRFEKFKPYVIGGLGFSLNKVGDIQLFSGRKIGGAYTRNLAWQVGLGATYTPDRKNHDDKWRLDVAYRYAHLGKLKTAWYAACANPPCGKSLSAESGKLRVHEFSIGILLMR